MLLREFRSLARVRFIRNEPIASLFLRTADQMLPQVPNPTMAARIILASLLMFNSASIQLYTCLCILYLPPGRSRRNLITRTTIIDNRPDLGFRQARRALAEIVNRAGRSPHRLRRTGTLRHCPVLRPDHETNERREAGESAACHRDSMATDRGFRILDVLAARRPASFSSLSSPRALPDEQRRVTAEGHESQSTAGSTNAIRIAGKLSAISRCARGRARTRPASVRWASEPFVDFSPNTLAITRDMGVCPRLVSDGRRRLLRTAAERCGSGVVELPVEWIRTMPYFNMNRFAALRPYTPPDVFGIFRRLDVHRWRAVSSPCTCTSAATVHASGFWRS